MAKGTRDKRGRTLFNSLNVTETSGLLLGGTAVTATAAELNKLDESVHSSSAALTEGVGLHLHMAVATYDFASDGGSQGTIAIGSALPDNAFILGGYVSVETTCTDGASDTATIAVQIESADDIVAAVAIQTGTPWDAGKQAIIPKFNTPESTGIKLTAANQVDVVIGTADLTAGKFHVVLFYTMDF